MKNCLKICKMSDKIEKNMLLRKMPLGIHRKILFFTFSMNIFWEVYSDFEICFQTDSTLPDMSEIELKSKNIAQKPANDLFIAI
jgi:hypothetical protein